MAIAYRSSTAGGRSPGSNPRGSNGSRKFVTREPVFFVDPRAGAPRHNSEHIVGHAARLGTMAACAMGAAEAGRAALEAARAAIADGGSTAQNPVVDDHAVQLAQDLFARGIAAGFTGVGNERRKRDACAYDMVRGSVEGSLPLAVRPHASPTNDAIPDIDHVYVGMNSGKGIVDSFYALITFSLPVAAVSSGRVKAVRIFRAELDDASFSRLPRRLSMNAVDRLASKPARTRIKNQDYLANYEKQLSAAGIDNALAALSPYDAVQGVRVQTRDVFHTAPAYQGAYLPGSAGDQAVAASVAPYFDPAFAAGVDMSVALDPASLRNIGISYAGRALLPPAAVAVGRGTVIGDASRLGNQAIMNQRVAYSGQNAYVAPVSNRLDFKEIAFFAPSHQGGRVIGDSIEYSREDPVIGYGRSYLYYAVTVDENMAESRRSRIVQVNVDGLRVPSAPSTAAARVVGTAVCVTANADDILVEKFEVYRKELSGKSRGATFPLKVLGGANGHRVSDEVRPRLRNGYVQVGESSNVGRTGGTLYDRLARPGCRYSYRVYAVDIFGNKSESPRQVEVFWPIGQKHVELSAPTVFAEVDALTNRVRITFQCSDARVSWLYLARRDLTLKQSAFVPPGQIEHIKLGTCGPGRGGKAFEDPRLGPTTDSQLAWNGIFKNDAEQVVFYDRVVARERTYQYLVYGIDRFGNKTSAVSSQAVFVSNRPLIYEPKNVVAVPVGDGRNNINAVKVTWDDGNIDVPAEDMLGDRDRLDRTSVRTLFQVSRRKSDEDRWLDFPLTDSRELTDGAAPPYSTSPNFVPGLPQPAQRPPLVELGQTYFYRVQALQSGAYISNFSQPSEVEVVSLLSVPGDFRARPSDTKVRPFYVALNWDSVSESAGIDRWEIERAPVNNFAADRLGAATAEEYAALPFKPYKVVYFESSRFRERTADGLDLAPANPEGSLLTGMHYYVDQDVDFGNTYFYRIRSVSVSGKQRSSWAYRGVKVTDESFERKLGALLNQSDRTDLSSRIEPMHLKGDYLASRDRTERSSFSYSSGKVS